MTDSPEPAALSIQEVEIASRDTALLVYFDAVVGSGIYGGSVLQIELAANVLRGHTVADQKVTQRYVGHLRCSVTAAQQLRAAIDMLLTTLEKPSDPMQAN